MNNHQLFVITCAFLVGVELLRDSGWAGIAHVRSAALVHAASVLPDTLQHTVDALSSARPTGTCRQSWPSMASEVIDSRAWRSRPYIDKDTGIMVHSVVERTKANCRRFPAARSAGRAGGHPDAGTRLYTFIWTLFSLMQPEACAIHRNL